MKPGIDEATVAEWVKETCLTFGASVPTAYRVAALFIEGLQTHHQEAKD